MPYIGHNPTNAGSFIEVDDFASNFNGSNVAFTLQVGGVDITPNQQNLLVVLDGVLQMSGSAYSVSGSTITFTGAPANGVDLYCVLMGQSASIGQGTIGADELKITGNGSSGQLLSTDGDGTFSYLSTTGITSVGTLATASIQGGQGYASSANTLATSVSAMALRVRGSNDASTSLFMGSLRDDAQQYIQSSNGAGSSADDIVLNPFGGKVGIGNGNASPQRDFVISNGGAGGMEFGAGDTSSVISLFNRSNSSYTTLNIEAKEVSFLTGTNPAETLKIESNGDINIAGQAMVLGTSASSTERLLRIARFATKATDQIIGELRYTGSSDGGHSFAGIKTYVHHTNGRGRLEFWVNDASAYAERMSLYYDGNLSIDGSLSSSDLTFKKNVKTITSALETVNSLRGVTYNWKVSTGKDTETKQYGMIAQEVEELLPELVKDYGDKKKKQLNYTSIIPVLVESIKELTAKVNALEGS